MSDATQKHAPGPWWTDGIYRPEELGVAIIAARTDCGPLPGNPTRGQVAWATQMLPEYAAECEANARLIAMAPDLLAERDALRVELAEARARIERMETALHEIAQLEDDIDLAVRYAHAALAKEQPR